LESRFFAAVYSVVEMIPAGKVMAYGQIAAMLGRPGAARTVGWAMQAAPRGRNLPCHRVVNRVGQLAPEYVFGGSEVQRAALEAEGVTFSSVGRVEMSKHLWRPDEPVVRL